MRGEAERKGDCARVRCAHPSKTATDGAASVVVVQEWASPRDPSASLRAGLTNTLSLHGHLLNYNA
jgi:hypothetical protein